MNDVYHNLVGVDDLTLLTKVDNDAIMQNLKKRLEQNIIYTYIGHVLIAMNPYKLIKGLYDGKVLAEYNGIVPMHP